MNPRRVVVIGAGINGLSTARFLLDRGVETTILDREPPGEGASSGNAGLLSIGHYPLTRPGVSWRGIKWMFDATSPLYIRPRLSLELASWLWRFHRHCTQRHLDRCMAVLCDMGFKSLAIIEEWIAEDAIACDYARDGWLDVVMRPEHMDAAEAEARSLVPYGYRHERLDGDAARRFDPVLRDEVAGAIHYLDSAHCHPGSLLDGIASSCVRRGARLRTDAEVVAIERDRTGRASGARLASGEVVEGDAVVLAAGVWSTELARSVGLHMPLVGARGYHIQCRGLPRLPRTGMVLHETFVAVTPMRAHGTGGVDELRLAGTLEIDRLGMPWRRERLAMLQKGAERYLHGIDRLSITSEWAGYRPCTSDGMPIIGASRTVPGLVINGGHAMMGMTLGPISAKAAVEDLFGERASIELGMVGVERVQG